MASQDPEEERQRITQLYAAMADGELEAIAADSTELTDVPRQALTDELARRRPEEATVAQTGAGRQRESVELADVVSIRQFRDLPEALLAKGALDSAEIESFLVDDNLVRMDFFGPNLVDPIKLCVKEEDAKAALDLLEQSSPEELGVEGGGPHEQTGLDEARQAEMIPPSKTRPAQINRAIGLLCLTLTIGTLELVIISWHTWRHTQVHSVAASLGAYIAIAIVFLGLCGFLIWKIAQGRNWARITWLIVFVIGLWHYPSSLRSTFHRSPVLAILNITDTAIEVYALLLMFTSPGRSWFSR